MSAKGNRRPGANGTAAETRCRAGWAAPSPTLPEAARRQREWRALVRSLTCYAALPPMQPLGDVCAVCASAVSMEQDGCAVQPGWFGTVEPLCWTCHEALDALRERLRRERFAQVVDGQGLDLPGLPPIDLECYGCDERRAS